MAKPKPLTVNTTDLKAGLLPMRGKVVFFRDNVTRKTQTKAVTFRSIQNKS